MDLLVAGIDHIRQLPSQNNHLPSESHQLAELFIGSSLSAPGQSNLVGKALSLACHLLSLHPQKCVLLAELNLILMLFH